ncbi:MAG: indolepyruvate ferredoxin oxidoreductase family protein, partial [Silicimonas sp.]|nr:indolepyruvate ferredoxin oxidoreductase family protein [Silicimonas sp.]
KASLLDAIELNGAKAAANQKAFQIGRWAALNPEEVDRVIGSEVVDLPKTLDEKIAFRVAHLEAYQSGRLARRYLKMVNRATDPTLKEAIAEGYHKVLAYKDEFEVARLLTETRQKAEAVFEGDLKLSYHLAPPILPGKDASGRPRKRAFRSWSERLWPLLARLRWLRGTPFNPFGYSADRRLERRLIRQYERDMAKVFKDPDRNRDAALALAELPLSVRGFGPVKEANAKVAAARREELLQALKSGTPLPAATAAE